MVKTREARIAAYAIYQSLSRGWPTLPELIRNAEFSALARAILNLPRFRLTSFRETGRQS
jgi:hypothetical protein